MTRSDISGFEFTLLLSYMAAYKADQTMGGTAMKTTQFTPGPWKPVKSRYPNDTHAWFVEIRHSGYKEIIAEVRGGHADHIGGKEFQGDKKANAHLIAAAPAMYEALLAVCATVCLNDDGTRFYAIDRKTERKITHSLSAARGEE